MSQAHVISGSCHHDCPDTCIWDVTVEDGRAVKLRGNQDHPTTRGQLCPKVNRLLDRVYSPDRVLTPLRRVGPKGEGRFEPIDWAEAIDFVTSRLQTVIAQSTASSVLQFSFDGTQGLIQKGVMADRFFDALGASDIRRHLCGVTASMAAADVTGVPFGMDPEDLRHSKTILLWGTNTFLTNRHLWPFIEEARSQGATLVVIDPIRTITARKADHFLQVRPGTDVALVLGMIHVLERDGLLDLEWIANKTAGWTALRASAAEMSPEEAALITGIESERIEWLARTYARKRPAAIRTLVGAEHRRNGRELMKAIAMLPSLTGAWRDVGGGLARSTQVYFETALNMPEDRPERRSFNMARLGEILNDPSLDPPIDALFVHNSNPAVICPDQNAVVGGLAREDLFTVVVEQFVTDTARYADVVLPATTQLEHLDLGIAWGHMYLSLNRPAIEPLGQALPNSEIFRRLAAGMHLDDPVLSESDESMIRRLLNSDHQWLEGIGFESLSGSTWQRLTLMNGHRPYVDGDVPTADGRLQLGGLHHVQPEAPPHGEGQLNLITRKQHLKFLNANYGGTEEHLPREGQPLLEIHALDAAKRGIGEGDVVCVKNKRGSLTVTAHLIDDVQPGVVSIPFGWWHRHTPEDRGVNALTNPVVPEDGVGSAAFHDTWVDVAKVPAT